MVRLYLAKGHNSWTNKDCMRVFSTRDEAESYTVGLTDWDVKCFSGKKTCDAVNQLVGSLEFMN